MSGMCIPCKSSTNVTISTTDVKKIYGLTKEEINDAELFSFDIQFNGNYGTKYLVSDIKDLAQEIYSNINNNDKRKQKYSGNIIDDNPKIDDMRENIQAYFEENNIDPDDNITMFVEKIIKRKYNSEFDEVIEYIQRKIKIDKLIDGHSNQQFIEDAKKHKEYDAYIYDNSNNSSIVTFNKMIDSIDCDEILIDRKKKIDKFIENNISNKYANLVAKLTIYKKYISNSNYNKKFEFVCRIINEHVEKKTNLDNKKQTLNKHIKKNVSNEYIKIVKKMPIYCEYTKELECNVDFDSVCQIIDERFKKDATQDERMNKIAVRCGQWFDEVKEHKEIKKIYKRYLLDGGDPEFVVDEIKNIIMRFNKQKTMNVSSSKNINLTGTDLKNYDDIKFDYLVGLINLRVANKSLHDIKMRHNKI